MPSRLADYLNAARRAHFVGRETERNFFRSAIQAESPPFFVLYIYGPGGIGKSTLLREFGRMSEETGWIPVYFDARNIEPLPEVFIQTLTRYIDMPGGAKLEAFMADTPQRWLLMVDTYETLAPLDDWLREHFLPQLPENVMVILSGRNPPSPAWRADAGWQTVLETLPLRNLTPDETRDYLARRNIPVSQQQAVMTFTHGHPLALSLVAETFAQREEEDTHTDFQSEFPPDKTHNIIQTLIKNFLQKVPGPAHRVALEACALVRVTSEPVLCEMLANREVTDLFEWLHELSFIEPRPGGLFPHDLARDALLADLRWRNPDWYSELHRRARHYYTHRISVTTGLEQQRALFDLVFLHRDNPFMRPFIEWQMGGSTLPDRLHGRDIPYLVEMVARHEGPHAAQIAAYWLEKQPQNALVPRTPEGQPAGFLLLLDLTAATPQERAADPAAQAAWNSLPPLRAGERATLFRFWMDAETYQAVSATQSVLFIHIARHYLTTPGLAYTFFPCADETFWTPLCLYINLTRLPQADFTLDGHSFAVFGHDWRREPPAQWLGLLAEREIATSPQAALPPEPGAPSLVVLSEPDFATAVRDALRDFKRASALTENPLLNSRLVVQRVGNQAGETQRTSTLQHLIEAAAAELKATPKETKYYRALYHTYFQPAANQEQAAELLDLPFSTYRRHLVRGVERITEILWNQELA